MYILYSQHTYKVTTFHIILVLVNFTSSSFIVKTSNTSVILTVNAFGTFNTPFVIKASHDIEGGMYVYCDLFIQIYYLTIFSIGELFFNTRAIDVEFQPGQVLVPLSIQLLPKEVGNMNLQFTVTLTIPPAAMSQSVVLGEPSVATVTVNVPGT